MLIVFYNQSDSKYPVSKIDNKDLIPVYDTDDLTFEMVKLSKLMQALKLGVGFSNVVRESYRRGYKTSLLGIPDFKIAKDNVFIHVIDGKATYIIDRDYICQIRLNRTIVWLKGKPYFSVLPPIYLGGEWRCPVLTIRWGRREILFYADKTDTRVFSYEKNALSNYKKRLLFGESNVIEPVE